MALVFDQDPMTKLHSKTWKDYLIGCKGKYQYRIYDRAQRQVFDRQDVSLHADIIGLNGNLTPTDRLICHGKDDKHINFSVLHSIITNLYQQ